MDKASAKNLVKDTLESSFKKEQFVNLVKNILNEFEEKTFIYRGNTIPKAFQDSIKTLERIGKYKNADKKVDILIVQLKKESSLDKARSKQRNFISWYLKSRNALKDGALVAFVSPNKEDWRFSFVRMEYKFDKEQKKIKEDWTPARRYSFLVGKNENSHTAQSCLFPLLKTEGRNPTLEDLESAFSIEKVTQEFYEKYRKLFDNLTDALDEIIIKDKKIEADFEKKKVISVDFSKKLLGQIVFLYFLQKKGWFGVKKGEEWGTGSKCFMRELFEKEHRDYKNFFNDILEPLFYEALKLEHTDDYYKHFDCRIPFLNGGLFDPLGSYDWVNTDILLPNSLFSNNTNTKEGDIGSGILDVFDRYNFTVKEDEPLEKEVAVDPEMLGKVFENLLEIKARKSKGTYYTPREIVHYMCQESLINYLLEEEELKEKVNKEEIEILVRHGESAIENENQTASQNTETRTYSFKFSESIRKQAELIDKKLMDIRICDPAVGSGAFPVGMMNEIIRVRNALTPFMKNKNKRTAYHFKRHAIQYCLYGVDIDSGAIEIAKLRLWLSLVVDEEDRETIQPLPNLDYKMVCGNSLLGVEKDLFNQEQFNQLEKLKPLYFNETSSSKKQEYKKQIDQLISEITKTYKTFDFEIYFSEVFHKNKGFDVVIANPPYGAKINKGVLDKIKQNMRFTRNANSAAMFIDYGINNLISLRGTLTYIVPKSLLFSEKWFDLVKAMLGKVSILIDVEKAFEKVKLEQVVFLYGNTIKTNHYLARKFLNKKFTHTLNISNKLVSKYLAWICDVSETEIKIAEKITSKEIRFMKDISQTKRGLPFQKILQKRGAYPVIGGDNISKYRITGEKGFISLKDFEKTRNKINFLENAKILSQNIIAHIKYPIPRIEITASIDNEGKMLSVDTVSNTILNTNDFDLLYILALINSRFISWYTHKFIYCSAIRTMHFDKYYIGKIPIINVSKNARQPLINLAKKILNITKTEDYLENFSKKKQVYECEKQIDHLVYKLYGLTQEEIKIVEGHTK